MALPLLRLVKYHDCRAALTQVCLILILYKQSMWIIKLIINHVNIVRTVNNIIKNYLRIEFRKLYQRSGQYDANKRYDTKNYQ